MSDPIPKPDTPMCDKVTANRENLNLIGEFIEWLESESIELMRWTDFEDSFQVDCPRDTPRSHRTMQSVVDILTEKSGRPAVDLGPHPKDCICKGTGRITRTVGTNEHVPAFRNIQDALAQFFEIDQAEYDREREELLAWWRLESERREAEPPAGPSYGLCGICNDPVRDADVAGLSNVRTGHVLCITHFREAKAAAKLKDQS